MDRESFSCSICGGQSSPQTAPDEGHDTVSAAAERIQKQRELEESRLNIQQGIQDREKDVKLLQQEVEAINGSADGAVEHSQKIFSQLIRLLEKRGSGVEQRVRSQQQTEVSRAKELQEKLEQEIAELKRKDAELQTLSHTQDHNQFLHSYPSLSALSGSAHSSSIKTRPLAYFEDVTAAVSAGRDQLQEALTITWTNVSQAAAGVDVLLSDPAESKTRADSSRYSPGVTLDPAEPTTRAGFLRCSQQLTLDPNTAHELLSVSDGDRRATYTGHLQPYYSHPDRFTYYRQVLSRESLSGYCYWEVEWKGEGVYVAVSYKSISRSGSEGSLFGDNDKSWALMCNRKRYGLYHNGSSTEFSGPWTCRVGVFLNHRAGILSFYSVSDTMTFLHRIQTTFTEPLHVGLLLPHSPGNSAVFIDPK
ncbi:tripartite motif-containing protein 16-like [Halichoeres trimaculatus]|uniref:tripartite motif-containing protein 16-like n=1 Tax=Halichoeres trimaculatus TaxID=147232 RepID=UPI003D9E6618